ncbi:OsmC family protein [Dyella jiangningensis]|uniref:OsmC family peroxiredoxin n=1 Tax=Dyella jiangningensis TaxID=1379159 RepID=A0A328P6Q5_9GAMM|nr:OsmC family protein [Dyella jiangningensis]RAO75944.1 OsmC family peroxiredoxin [Dyella jiangningensis]
MKRTASAAWAGGLKEGTGTISTATGVLRDAPYGFRSRFEDGPGTNPEELLGAAHAGCFSMALALGLEQAGFVAKHIETKAVVTLDKDGDGFAITTVDLTCRASVPGIDAQAFDKVAQATKAGCPVSKVLKAQINLDAQLES